MAEYNNFPCITGDVVSEYVDLANGYTQELSASFVGAMQLAFYAFVGIWVIIHGYRIILAKGRLADLGHESVFVFISWLLLYFSGPGLVNMVFVASLKMMGAGAATALRAANKDVVGPDPSSSSLGDGMTELVCVAEQGVLSVVKAGVQIAMNVGWTNWLPVLYAVALIIPYFLLLIVYFAQVVVSIFRITMLSTLSPFMMLGFGFGWGRDSAVKGIRTLLASFMVLFGSTLALAVMLYGVTRLGLDNMQGQDLDAFARINNPKFVIALAMGWLGTAFQAEATGIANSIMGSQLTNQAAALITAGAAATGAGFLKYGRKAMGLAPSVSMNSQTGELTVNGQNINQRVSELLGKATKQTPKP